MDKYEDLRDGSDEVESGIVKLRSAARAAIYETEEAQKELQRSIVQRDALMKSVQQQAEREKALLAEVARSACEIAELKAASTRALTLNDLKPKLSGGAKAIFGAWPGDETDEVPDALPNT